ncbi:MAG: adenosylcobalamin-dependent ribonucleoside-diphosphate reductase [Acidilobaceae archaeon]|nr:adenosylcobalamin-dependent ribonucleoside-diphosphate reductase [Acidilobaceae archaeon]
MGRRKGKGSGGERKEQETPPTVSSTAPQEALGALDRAPTMPSRFERSRARSLWLQVAGMGEELELRLIQESAIRPEAEDEAKVSLLKRIYAEVNKAYSGKALNGGLLAPLPECVRKGEPCPDDMLFTYNAIRVLMSRYMSRGERSLFTETPSMVMARVALGLRGRVEPWGLYRLLVEGHFMFNSPTLFNLYVDRAYGTLSACYVTPVYDSMREIMDAGVVQAMTFKWGGGQGFSFSELRPRWDIVKGTSSFSSGPMSFMQLFDVITELVKQGGKRRGANMGIMHAWHPDIYTPGFDPYVALRNELPPQLVNLIDATKKLIEQVEAEGYEVEKELKALVDNLSRQGWWSKEDAGFIQAKKPPLQDANLTNFNISVGINDAFMKALMEDAEWWMVNPRFSEKDGVYRIHYTVSRAYGLGILEEIGKKAPWVFENPYLGIFEDVLEEARLRALRALEEHSEAKGWPLSPNEKNTFAWKVRARELWEEIVRNAWGGGDPGVIYFDNHNKWSPTPWLGAQNATNPCSEQVLYPFENCNLGSFNLAKYVKEGKFDLERLSEDMDIIMDSMDAMIDINNHPDERHYKVNLTTRKVGIGFMGLAEALAKLGYPYDSDEAVAFSMIVSAALEAFSWRRSWELGAKLGHAPAFECKRYDWRRFECVEKGDPEKLSELLVPALVKAQKVMRVEDGWVKVRYHEGLRIPQDMRKFSGITEQRVEEDGSLRLVPVETLLKVLKEAFGISEEHMERALSARSEEIASDPRLAVALAVIAPGRLWEALKEHGRRLGAKAPRNTVTTTVAPTGTISIIAGTSSGIEPYFALVFKRQVAVGTFLEIIREFRKDLLELAAEHDVSKETVMHVYDIIREHKGSIRMALLELEKLEAPEGFKDGLRKLARKYATAMDFDLWYHVAHQIAAQLFIDQAISKTVNLPKEASVEDVHMVYLLAWLGGLKGFTVYRDESKGVQVIVFGGKGGKEERRLIKKRGKMRMAIVRRELRPEEAAMDAKLREVFEVREEKRGEEVVVEITENSTCKTCER